MKQTKNALTMLLNAYRAVFKAAYVKGLASAVVLTAGLAAGANAASVGDSGFVDDADSAVDVVINDGQTHETAFGSVAEPNKTLHAHSITVTSGSLSLTNNGYTPPTSTGLAILNTPGDIVVDGGDLSFKGFNVIGDQAHLWSAPTNNVKVSAGNLNLEAARIAARNVELDGGVVTIGGAIGGATAGDNLSYIYAGTGEDGSMSISNDVKVNLNPGSMIAAGHALYAEGGDVYFNGTSFYDAKVQTSKATSEVADAADAAEFKGTNFTVNSDKYGAFTGNLMHFTGGVVTVAENGNLLMDGRGADLNTDEEKYDASHISVEGGAFVNNGTMIVGSNNGTDLEANSGIINNAGTLNLNGNTTIAQEVQFTNSGTINVSEGNTLTFTGERDLTSDGTINNAGKITVNGNISAADLADLGYVAETTGNVEIASGSNLTLTADEVTLDQAQLNYVQGVTQGGVASDNTSNLNVKNATLAYGEDSTLKGGLYNIKADSLAFETSQEDISLNAAIETAAIDLGNVKSLTLVAVEEGGDTPVSQTSLMLTGEQDINTLINVSTADAADGTRAQFRVNGNINFANINVQKGGETHIGADADSSVTSLTVASGGKLQVTGNFDVVGNAEATSADEVGVTIAANTTTVDVGGTLNLGSSIGDNFVSFVDDSTEGGEQGGEVTPPEQGGEQGGEVTTPTEPGEGEVTPPTEPGEEAGEVTPPATEEGEQGGAEAVAFALADTEGDTSALSVKVDADHLGEMNVAGTVNLAFAEGTKLTADQVNSIVDQLLADGSTGDVILSGVTTEVAVDEENGTVDAEQLGHITASTDEFKDLTMTADTSADDNRITNGTANGADGAVTVGSIAIADAGETAYLEGNWVLGNAEQNVSGAGMFAANDSGDAMNIDTTGNLTLANNDASVASIKNVTVNGEDKTLVTEGTGSIQTGALTNKEGSVAFTAASTTVSGGVTAQTMTVKGALNADKVTLGGGQGDALSSSISGAEHEIGTLAFEQRTDADGAVVEQSLTIDGGAVVNVDALNGASGVTINVGSDGETSSSATLISQVTNNNGALIVGDPDWSKDSTKSIHVAVTQPITSAQGSVGGFVAAQNNYTTLGMTEDEANQLAADYKLSQKGILSMMGIGDKMQLAGGALVVSGLPGSEAAGKAQQDTVYLGNKTALYFDEDAATGTTAGITFNNNNGTVQDAGGQIIVGGDITADSTLKLFANANGSDVTLAAVDGQTTASIEVTSANRVLSGVIENAADLSNLQLSVNENARQILSGMSDPIYEMTLDIFDDSSLDGAGVDFVRESFNASVDGSNVEAAARLATFGGAAQVGLLASDTTSDLIADRTGFAKSNSAMVYSGNAEGAAIWFAPVFRNQDSDSFDADGLDYGADIDLYGVAFGVDNTSNGVRYGAMFNIGSGDADGQGAGSSVSNDFDYYSLGAYIGAEIMPNLTVTGDLSYTSVDNDLDASSGLDGWDSLKASADTEVMSLGVTGQYKMDLGMMDVTPHVGMRFSHLELDDYTVRSNGTAIASVDNDSVNVFSIPVGVTLSKDFSAGAWTVKPVFDLTLTANMGDDEIDSTAQFTGADFGTALSSELVDSFTYGTTLGVAAETGDFSLGFGLNYTGSDNTDEFGVDASVRYTF